MTFDSSKSLSNQFSIPCLRPWQETGVFDAYGHCLLPTALGRQCELTCALDGDYSNLKYVKKHIRFHGFGFESGTFHNAYRDVKSFADFNHEMIHLWLNIWGSMPSFVPSQYSPHYDGNAHAEALVISMQKLVKQVMRGERDIYNKAVYTSDVQWSHQDVIAAYQQKWNQSAIVMQRESKNMPVYDFMRMASARAWMNERSVSAIYPYEHELVTPLGEKLLNPKSPELEILKEVADSFYDACQPLIESLRLTVQAVQEEMRPDGRPLFQRTIDLMLRTLKVREQYQIMHTGEPRVFTVSHISWLKKCERVQHARKVRGEKSFQPLSL